MAVGIFNSTISFSLTLSRYLTIDLMEFPCATTITFLPSYNEGHIVSAQYGSTLSIHSFNDSVLGKRSGGIFKYLISLPGKSGLFKSIGGGGISKLLLHILTYASPYFAATSDLFNPVNPP